MTAQPAARQQPRTTSRLSPPLTLADLPLRDELRGEVPYGAPQLDVPVRLNVNENPHPPSPELVRDIAAAVAEAAAELNRYPDRDAVGLRGDLAGYLELREAGLLGRPLDASCVWAANGSNEVMQQLLQAFGGPGRTLLTFSPTYSMYPEYCRDTFTRFVAVPRHADFTVSPQLAVDAVLEHDPDVVVLTSPNNPTGTALPVEAVEAVCERSRGVVVVDEAYAEFRREGTPSALSLLGRHPRLVVTRTMSKAFGMAGLRVGYLVADPAVVDAVQLVRLPYHLSAVTQAVARTAVAHAPALLAEIASLRRERDDLVGWLRGRGLEVATSDANFVLFGRFTDRHAVWQGLLDHGVLIRETGPDGWLRVSVGAPAETAAFRDALVDVLDQPGGKRLPAPPTATTSSTRPTDQELR